MPTVVGYQSISVNPGSTTAMGVQFENVANPSAGIPLKSVLSVDVPWGSAEIDSTADQIWVFTGTDWTKYFFYTPERDPHTGYWALKDTTEEIPDTLVLTVGQSFFFRRSDIAEGASTVNLSGAVVPFTATKSASVLPGSTTAMSWPWPEAMKIKDFTKYLTTPWGSAEIDSTADQIWVFTGADWTKYFFYTPERDPHIGYWALKNTTLEVGDNVKIDAGTAFFFRRSDIAEGSETISFDRSK